MSDDKKLTPRAEDFSAWYNEVVLRAELADYSPVRGCMVIRPYGYRLWELMRDRLDVRFKETGHQNAYFPLFIPQSFLAREAEHIEGFAKEAAVVTHTRLKATGEPGARALIPDPDSKLEEPLIIRPTSETIIYEMFSKWVQSYRDLPLLINQWANVVRWEMRTRLFLRTTEFLWQEGHTAHVSEAEAEAETLKMLGVYREFMEGHLAMPVVTGRKSESEKFAGALRTYATESMMQDNKALQAGTSHNLGQNFARQFALKFAAESGGEEFAWNTSWGVSTRMIGGLVMTHSDDQGIVMPPMVAPIQLVIVPIYRKPEERDAVLAKAAEISARLGGVRVHVDARENMTAGAKFYEWELKGVPFRMEIGPKDLAKGQVVLARRVLGEGDERKQFLPEAEVVESLPRRLEEFQRFLLDRARARREANSHRGVADYARFREIIEGEGGFVYTGWCGSAACEAQVKEDTNATIRVLPDEEFRSPERPADCVRCGAPAVTEAMWAKSY
ncbi:MAG: Prolyl-tRNA synthetase, archaeal/eukaryal type [uncultured Gemmatimonadaceae bacterium]|uniref:Proline--tRNA ligase n=1 Tax=uncultured Gemmatimonadaceae bacterium TaxID=246130 RepID=A0A6J4LQK3_9BACT|nr:MAG: Prolyl-tRNA synthetase, archaeal/eukaryal type [uncultured Gemmatimonadaceae bacterium]